MEDLYFYIAILITLWIATTHFLHKIRNLPPTPFPAFPLIGHLHLFREPIHRTLTEISRRHGSLLFLRLGCRRVLLVSSPAATEECLHRNDVVFADRPRFVAGEILGYGYSTLNWASYGDLWRNLRRISNTEILSHHRLHLLAGIRADEVRALLRRIYRQAPSADGSGYRTVDLKSAFLETTTNVMTRMLAGRRYYGEGEGEESEEGRRFKALTREITDVGGVTTVGDFLPLLRWIGIRGTEKRFKALFEKIDRFMQYLVDDYRRSDKIAGDIYSGSQDEISTNNKTMIEVLLSLQKADPGFYTEDIIKGLVLVMLLAGTDTSSGTMEWALSFLLNHPATLKKVQSEIDSYVGHDHLIDESDLDHLPYLHSIILETLRLRPVLPLLVHHSSDECTVGGYRVPRGTILMVNVWAMHHNPEIWEQAGEFKPERFEGLQGNKVGFKMLPFGAGRRACPGEGLAIRMVGLALGSIIQCFEWERLGEEPIDMRENVGLTVPKIEPLMAKCRPRKEMVKLVS